jgi:hypothetical protein
VAANPQSFSSQQQKTGVYDMADGSKEMKAQPATAVGFHGAALRWNVFCEVWERLEKASEAARRIGSPAGVRVARLIKGVNKYLGHEHGNSMYVADVRSPSQRARDVANVTVPMGPADESDLPGDSGFALRIQDLSMVDAAGPVSFPLNSMIIVDPDRVAKPGDFVVIREIGAREACLRRFDFDGEKYSLHALNHGYSTLPLLDSTKIVGVATHLQLPILSTRLQ